MPSYSLSVNLLAPHLTPENADALLDAATQKTTGEIEQLLAECFPRSETLALVQALPPSPPLPQDQRPPVPTETCPSDGVGVANTLAARASRRRSATKRDAGGAQALPGAVHHRAERATPRKPARPRPATRPPPQGWRRDCHAGSEHFPADTKARRTR